MVQWVEKYRPDTLDDVIGQDAIVEMLKLFVEQEKEGKNELPHFLFAGITGTGKTAAAEAFAKDLWGDEWRRHWISFNASDDRGINTVREKIKNIAKQQGEGTFRIVFLDEVDSMTKDAQRALRRIMEIYSENTKFILCCNHPSMLMDAISGRCVKRTFAPVDQAALVQHLKNICEQEDVKYEDEAIEYIAKNARGKVRNAIQELQAMSPTGEITLKLARRQMSTITRDEIRRIFQTLKNSEEDEEERMQRVDKEIAKLYQSGLSPQEILRAFYEFIIDKHPYMTKTMAKIGEIDANLANGANPLLQLRCFMAWSLRRSK